MEMGIPLAHQLPDRLINMIPTSTSAHTSAAAAEMEARIYDVAIIGGGLAGLALAIQLSKEDFSVVLFEKEQYPFHKVCGEYISFECWNFLESLGYPLSDMDLPAIRQLLVTAPNGDSLQHALPLGGFGISRFKIDADLCQLAAAAGASIRQNEKVNQVDFDGRLFTIQTHTGHTRAKCAVGSYGKRSNLDVKWQRPFTFSKKGKLDNYIGVKYHIKSRMTADTIALHNFEDGYCGISRVEDDTCCLCYLTTARNLNRSGNSIAAMEKEILFQNRHLKDIFSNAYFLWDAPVTISQISFNYKKQVENHVLMVGDAAGMITPLCGNGMSMALHGSKIAAGCLADFLQHRISRNEMEDNYTRAWKLQFAKRLRSGRLIQRLFGKSLLTNMFIGIMKRFPKLTAYLIRQTHGEPF